MTTRPPSRFGIRRSRAQHRVADCPLSRSDRLMKRFVTSVTAEESCELMHIIYKSVQSDISSRRRRGAINQLVSPHFTLKGQ